jgi:hypothetical protein
VAPSIEVDNDVLEELGRRARPFIDTTPNHVLRGLLDLGESGEEFDEQTQLLTITPDPAHAVKPRATSRAKRSKSSTRTRAPKGALLDERAYEIPILQALAERGGRAAAREVVERVGQLVDDQLTEMDRESVETGGIRWQARVQFARLRLKEQECVASDSPRGVWEITDKGRQRLADTTQSAA